MIMLFAGVILLYLLLWLGTFIFRTDWTTLVKNISGGSGKEDVAFLRFMIISQDISLFILPGIIIITLMKQSYQGNGMFTKLPRFNEVVLVIILGFSVFPVTSFTGQLNSAMHLPDWLSGVEQWMADKEDQANNAIDNLIVARSFGSMAMNLLVIAVIPAIGEEFIFRGVFQKILSSLFKSGHFAVWFTAILFSALHFQFFGFIPRLILGLIFGYLFLWGGTLWLPVISHFVNNAFPVILAYVQGLEKINTPQDLPLWKQAIVLPLPVAICLVILFYFRNKSNNKKNELAKMTPLDPEDY
jgi:hypothetical protein